MLDVWRNCLYWLENNRDAKSLALTCKSHYDIILTIKQENLYWTTKLKIWYNLVIQEPTNLSNLRDLYNLLFRFKGDFTMTFRECSKNNKIECISILFQDEELCSRRNCTYAMEQACQKGYTKLVEMLLQYNKVVPIWGSNSFITIACEFGHLAIVNMLLLDKRVDPSELSNYAIAYASKNGHLAIVERLLQDDRVDPSENNDCALRFAFRNGHVCIVDRLLQDNRVDPTSIEYIR